MKNFMTPDPSRIENAELRKHMFYLKKLQGGTGKICKVMEDLNKLAVKEENRAYVQRLLKLGFDKETIMKGLNLNDAEYDELVTPLAI